MPPSVIKRRFLTDAVVAEISTATTKPVGNGEAPDGGGWAGEINDSNFTPYCVVTPMDASQGDGPIRDPQTDLVLPYAITNIGVSQSQCEWMADESRAAVLGMIKDTIAVTGATDLIIQYVWVTGYGAVDRTSEEPPYYVQNDIVSIQVTPA